MKKNSLVLDCKQVSVRRGLKNVLHDLTFQIARGECVALVGPNGSGKSTLLKLLTRELYPTEGTLSLFGEETWDVFELRSKLGIVSNDFQALFTRELTGFDVVASGFFTSIGLWEGDVITPAMKKRILSIMKKLDIGHLEKCFLSNTSSGEARRLLMARALVHNPEFLVFDEPTNSLDIKAQSMFRDSLTKLANQGIGILLVTHHLSDFIPEIHRTLLLKEGHLIADGETKKTMTNRNLSHLFDMKINDASK